MNPLQIQQLEETDRWRLRQHFKSLDANDRHLRFGLALSDVAIDHFIDLINFDTDALFGVNGNGFTLVALVHVAPVGDGAELGLSVDPEFRRQGVGGALFARAIDWARRRRLHTIYMHCLRENQAIMHLATSHGMTLTSAGPDSNAVLLLPLVDFETWNVEHALHWQAPLEPLDPSDVI